MKPPRLKLKRASLHLYGRGRGQWRGRALILLPADWLPAAGASDDWSPARGTPGPARGAPAVHKEAAMAAEASTACLSLSAYVERKSRTWGAAEGCTRCARKMTGEEREGCPQGRAGQVEAWGQVEVAEVGAARQVGSGRCGNRRPGFSSPQHTAGLGLGPVVGLRWGKEGCHASAPSRPDL